MSRINNIFLLVIFGASSTRGTPSVYLSSTTTEWGHPPANCPLVLDIDNVTVYQQATKAMKAARVPTTWLPIKRVDLGGWWWTSGDFYGTHISSREWVAPGMDCAVLRSLDKILDDVYCDRDYGYFMCEGSPSTYDLSAFATFNVSGGVYNLYNSSGTWYNAAEGCYSKGQTLAAFENSKLKSTLDTIAQNTNKWANIWIGLRKREFLINSTRQTTFFKWGKNQPARQEDKNCVVVDKTHSGVTEWATRNCSESHVHLCGLEIQTKTTISGTPLDDPGYCLQNRTTMVTYFEHSINGWKSATIALIAFFLLVAICLIFIGSKVFLRRKNKGGHAPERSGKAVPPVSVPLLAVTGNQQNPEKELPKKDAHAPERTIEAVPQVSAPLLAVRGNQQNPGKELPKAPIEVHNQEEDREVPMKQEPYNTKETQASLSHMLERYLTLTRTKDTGGCKSWNITWSEARWVVLSKTSNAVLVVCEDSKGKDKLFVQNDETNEGLYENNINALKFEMKPEDTYIKVTDTDINKRFYLGFKTSDDRKAFKDCLDLLRALRLVMS